MIEKSLIRSEKLSFYKNIINGFSLRNYGNSKRKFGFNLSFNVGDDETVVKGNRESFLRLLDFNGMDFAIAGQCHSDNVTVANENKYYPDCDALITNRKGVLLTVIIADCAPVLLFDKQNEVIAAVHSGWKGASLNIVQKAVRELGIHYRTAPINLIAYIGASARSCCYEVGQDVANLFSSEIIVYRSGNSYLDLGDIVRKQLVHSGVDEKNIEISSYCTICNPSLFHSYRRDRDKSGRMMAAIGLI